MNRKGGVGKTTTTVNLGAALAATGRYTIIDLDQASPPDSAASAAISVAGYLSLLTELTALAPDPGNDPVIRELVAAREQIRVDAGLVVEACRELSEDDVERLGPDMLLFPWIGRLDEALSAWPTRTAQQLVASQEIAEQLETIEEAAREVGERATAEPAEFLDNPTEARLLAALTSVMQLRHTLCDRLPAATRAARRSLAEHQDTPEPGADHRPTA